MDDAHYMRKALAIAIDWEEYLAIFANGRGVPSMSVDQNGVVEMLFADGMVGKDFEGGLANLKEVVEKS